MTRLLAFLHAHTAPDELRKRPEAAMRDARLTLRELEPAARRLPRMAGGVELTDNEFTGATNAQFATATNWSGGHVPTTSERAVVPVAKTCELKTAREFGAFKARGKFTCTAAGTMTLTATIAAPGNVVLDLLGAESVTFNGALAVSGSYAGFTQTIDTGGFSVLSFTVGSLATGTYKLTNSLTTTATGETVAVKNNGKGKLEFNGQTVKTNILEFVEGSSGDFTGATIKCTGVGLVFMLNSAGSTFTGLPSCTLEVSDRVGGGAAKVVNGAGKEIGTIIASGFNVALESLTCSVLRVENSECAAEKGCKLKASTSVTVTTIIANGTEANPARLESTVSGTAAKFKLPEQELAAGFLAIKDITVETGVLYVPPAHGSNVSGNTIIGTTIKFEAKPGGKKTFEVEGSLTAKSTITSSIVKAAPASGTLTAKGTLQGTLTKIAVVNGTLTARSTLTGAQSNIRIVTGALTGRARLTGSAAKLSTTQGTLAARATLAGATVKSAIAQGTLAATSRLTGTTRMTVVTHGMLAGSGRIVATLRTTMNTKGTLTGAARLEVAYEVVRPEALKVAVTFTAESTAAITMTADSTAALSLTAVSAPAILLTPGG